MIKTEGEFNEVKRMLESDLDSLFKLVFATRTPLLEGDIRLASVILRKWLLDGLLSKFCKAADEQARFEVFDTSHVMGELKQQTAVNYFLPAGVRLNGRTISSISNATIPYPGSPLLACQEMPTIELRFGQFLRQKRLYFNGRAFTCEDIIKYAANKLGGAHLSFAREGTMQLLDEAAEYMKFGGPVFEPEKLPAELYLILEPESSEVLSGIHLEIVAAAASFVQVKIGEHRLREIHRKNTLWSALRRRTRSDPKGFQYYDYSSR